MLKIIKHLLILYVDDNENHSFVSINQSTIEKINEKDNIQITKKEEVKKEILYPQFN